ncbi:MAG: TetR/AcrR family transcriptional regulator, partial [Lachnospiraceae bacterium]
MDKRVIKTKRALFIALSELLREKNIQDITVTDLTRQAGINRKTFYNHFSDVHDVLDDLEHQIVESLIEEFEANKQQGLY